MDYSATPISVLSRSIRTRLHRRTPTPFLATEAPPPLVEIAVDHRTFKIGMTRSPYAASSNGGSWACIHPVAQTAWPERRARTRPAIPGHGWLLSTNAPTLVFFQDAAGSWLT